jgi:tripartite-type tricarboxylate transporter receptor subunit TctC
MRNLLYIFLCLASAVSAQAFPDKPIRIVIPYTQGGGTDNLLRIISPTVSANLGQPVIIDNRPGASSMIGSELVSKASPDGYTLLATDSAFLINPGLFKSKLPFDTTQAFTGVSMLASAPVLLVVHPSVPAKTLPDLIALARAKPGYLNYASGGSGAATHVAGEMLKQITKVFIVHIPYKGTAPAMTDLLAGQVQMQFAGISTAKAHVDAGRLRAIAVTGKQRNPAMPNVPTFEEHGVLNLDADSYWGLYAPTGVPPATLGLIHKAFVDAMKNPSHSEKLAALGYLVIANSPQEHNKQYQMLVSRFTEVIDRARITAD